MRTFPARPKAKLFHPTESGDKPRRFIYESILPLGLRYAAHSYEWARQADFRRLRGGTVSRRLNQAVVVFLAAYGAAQLIRPDRTNPPTDTSRTIQAHMGTSNGLVPVLDRACRDCHSNATTWPWYTQIAPVSWLMAYAV